MAAGARFGFSLTECRSEMCVVKAHAELEAVNDAFPYEQFVFFKNFKLYDGLGRNRISLLSCNCAPPLELEPKVAKLYQTILNNQPLALQLIFTKVMLDQIKKTPGLKFKISLLQGYRDQLLKFNLDVKEGINRGNQIYLQALRFDLDNCISPRPINSRFDLLANAAFRVYGDRSVNEMEGIDPVFSQLSIYERSCVYQALKKAGVQEAADLEDFISHFERKDALFPMFHVIGWRGSGVRYPGFHQWPGTRAQKLVALQSLGQWVEGVKEPDVLSFDRGVAIQVIASKELQEVQSTIEQTQCWGERSRKRVLDAKFACLNLEDRHRVYDALVHLGVSEVNDDKALYFGFRPAYELWFWHHVIRFYNDSKEMCLFYSSFSSWPGTFGQKVKAIEILVKSSCYEPIPDFYGDLPAEIPYTPKEFEV